MRDEDEPQACWWCGEPCGHDYCSQSCYDQDQAP